MASAGPQLLQIGLELLGAQTFAGEIRRFALDPIREMRESADRAHSAITELRTAQIFTGGGAAGVGGLASAFESIGIQAERMGDIAEGLRERLFRDPLAMQAFGRAVIPARLGGPQDSARILDEAVRLLRETTDAEERLMTARRLGLEALLPLADLDERHFQAMRREGAVRGALVDDELRGLRATEDSHNARLKAFQDERDLERERSRLRVKNWFREYIQLPYEELTAIGGPLDLNPKNRRLRQEANEQQSAAAAQRAAMEENTLALRMMRDEFANAGPRARGAVPGEMRGTALARGIESEDIRWGAFSLSGGGI